jgi:hypothetical protein
MDVACVLWSLAAITSDYAPIAPVGRKTHKAVLSGRGITLNAQFATILSKLTSQLQRLTNTNDSTCLMCWPKIISCSSCFWFGKCALSRNSGAISQIDEI